MFRVKVLRSRQWADSPTGERKEKIIYSFNVILKGSMQLLATAVPTTAKIPSG
jgi:isoleucyl-tRNA synthetase